MMVRLAGFTAINEEAAADVGELNETIEARESRLISEYETALKHIQGGNDTLAEVFKLSRPQNVPLAAHKPSYCYPTGNPSLAHPGPRSSCSWQ